jgi:DNA-binding MarR family transcriptional regulator
VAPPRNPNVLLRMFTTGQLANQLLARELEPVGFSPNQFAVTSVVGALGPITPTDLASQLGMAPTTLSAWIARLTRAGHIRRRPNPQDGRSALLEITTDGRAALDRAGPRFVAALDQLEAALGDDLDGVWAAGDAVETALRALLLSSSVSQ